MVLTDLLMNESLDSTLNGFSEKEKQTINTDLWTEEKKRQQSERKEKDNM